MLLKLLIERFVVKIKVVHLGLIASHKLVKPQIVGLICAGHSTFLLFAIPLFPSFQAVTSFCPSDPAEQSFYPAGQTLES
jgi:hypothetical protein